MAVEEVKGPKNPATSRKTEDKRKSPPGAEAGAAPGMRGGETARATQEKESGGPGKAHSGGIGQNVDVKA